METSCHKCGAKAARKGERFCSPCRRVVKSAMRRDGFAKLDAPRGEEAREDRYETAFGVPDPMELDDIQGRRHP